MCLHSDTRRFLTYRNNIISTRLSHLYTLVIFITLWTCCLWQSEKANVPLVQSKRSNRIFYILFIYNFFFFYTLVLRRGGVVRTRRAFAVHVKIKRNDEIKRYVHRSHGRVYNIIISRCTINVIKMLLDSKNLLYLPIYIYNTTYFL